MGRITSLIDSLSRSSDCISRFQDDRFKIVRGATEFGNRLRDRPPQFWKLLRPEQNESDEEDSDHFLNAYRTYRVPSLSLLNTSMLSDARQMRGEPNL